MSGTSLDAAPPPDRRYALGVAVWFVIVLGAASVHVAHPDGSGEWALRVVVCVALVALGLGPLLRGARPLSLWIGLTLGSGLGVVGMAFHPFAVRRQGGGESDVFVVLSYIAFTVWFVVLARRIGRITPSGIADAGAAATAVVLTIWVMPHADGGARDLTHLVRWALYPILDALAFLLLGHIAVRLGHRIRAWWWAFAAMGVLLVLDLTQIYLGPGPSRAEGDVLGAFYLLPYWALAVAACHPSIPDLPHTPVYADDDRPYAWRSALLYLTVIPGVASLALPPTTPQDAKVHAALVFILVTLLFVRLLGTMSALATAERHSRFRASHDLVTGLLNRSALLTEVSSRLEDTSATGRSTALLFLDCDNFKGVNDTWGHPAGDALLREIARRLPAALREDDVVARHAGDEFVIACAVSDVGEAERIAERIQSFFEIPFRLTDDVTHAASASIGIAVAGPGQDVSAVELLERADMAMYVAKSRGRAEHAVYDHALERQNQDRSRIAVALRRGIEDERISVDLRPVMAGAGFDTLVGWEASPRWEHPRLGVVAADRLIPLADELGLLVDLDRLVLVKALEALVDLRSHPPFASTSVAVDVSAASLRQTDIATRVSAALDRTGIAPHLLRLEVAESLLVDGSTPVAERLREVRDTGVSVCIDDFGTGHASLTVLLRAPVDSVKVHRSLVQRVDGNPRELRRLGSIVRLLRRIGVPTVVADGVDRADLTEHLHELGFAAAQGHVFGCPTPLEHVVRGESVVCVHG